MRGYPFFQLIICLILFTLGKNSFAFNWNDLWNTKDQQAQKLMKQGNFAKAKETFQRDDWKGIAAYEAKDYTQAAQFFSSDNTAKGYYNKGNALAYLGHFPEAVKAYDNALKLDPTNQDAIYNRKLVLNLLNQSKQDQKNSQNSQPPQKNQTKTNSLSQSNNKNTNKEQNKQQNSSQTRDSKQNSEKNKLNSQSPSSNQTQDKSAQSSSDAHQNQPNDSDRSNINQDKDTHQKMNNKMDNDNTKTKNKNDSDARDFKKKMEERANDTVSKVSDQSSDNKFPKDAKIFKPMDELNSEKVKAKQQWLKLIPDEPAGLLRQKFLRDHLRRQYEQGEE